MRSTAWAGRQGGPGGRRGAHRGRCGVAVILQERHWWGLARAQPLQLGLQQLLLGLQLGLAAQRHLKPLQLLLQHLPLAQQVNPAGRQVRVGERGGLSLQLAASSREGEWEPAIGGTPSPLPGVDVLLLIPELTLQLIDRLLPAEHRLGGHR